MLRSLYSGISGMKNHQIRMDVVGNNISNVNTTGFKAGRVNFQDTLSQTISSGGGGTNPAQLGTGAAVASVSNNFGQGPTQSTGRTMDLAIQGNGFFIVKDLAGNEFYTRDGVFFLDTEGYLVNGDGMRVQSEKGDIKVYNGPVSTIAISAKGVITGTNTNGEPLQFSSSEVTYTDATEGREAELAGSSIGDVKPLVKANGSLAGDPINAVKSTVVEAKVKGNSTGTAPLGLNNNAPPINMSTPEFQLTIKYEDGKTKTGEYILNKDLDAVRSWSELASQLQEKIDENADLKGKVKVTYEAEPYGGLVFQTITDPNAVDDKGNPLAPNITIGGTGVSKYMGTETNLSATGKSVSTGDFTGKTITINTGDGWQEINLEATYNVVLDTPIEAKVVGNTSYFTPTQEAKVIGKNTTDAHKALAEAEKNGTTVDMAVSGKTLTIDYNDGKTDTHIGPISFPANVGNWDDILNTINSAITVAGLTAKLDSSGGLVIETTTDPNELNADNKRVTPKITLSGDVNYFLGIAPASATDTGTPASGVVKFAADGSTVIDFTNAARGLIIGYDDDGNPSTPDTTLDLKTAVGMDNVTSWDDLVTKINNAISGIPNMQDNVEVGYDPNTGLVFNTKDTDGKKALTISGAGTEFFMGNATKLSDIGVPAGDYTYQTGLDKVTSGEDLAKKIDNLLNVIAGSKAPKNPTDDIEGKKANVSVSWENNHLVFISGENTPIELGGEDLADFIGGASTAKENNMDWSKKDFSINYNGTTYTFTQNEKRLAGLNSISNGKELATALNKLIENKIGLDKVKVSWEDKTFQLKFTTENTTEMGVRPSITISGADANDLIGTNPTTTKGVAKEKGEEQPQVPFNVIRLAMLQNPEGLIKVGGNLFQTSPASGKVTYGAGNTEGFGDIKSGYLEMSNVDLAEEFTNIITTQRGYQANARVITVSDSLLEELIQLKR